MPRFVPFLLIVAVLGGCGVLSPFMSSSAPTSTTSTSTTSTSTSTTVPAVQQVGLMGDSLLHQARRYLPAVLPFDELEIRSAPGLLAGDARYYVPALREAGVDALGVVLGSNNARDGLDRGDLPAIRRIIDQLQWAPCIRWVTLIETTPSAQFNTAARAINAELVRQARRRPAMELVEWDEAIAANPAWVDEDGLHHSEQGRQALAGMLGGALAQCPGRLD